MKIVKTFEISEEESKKIKNLFHRLVSLRNLVKTSVTAEEEEFEPLMQKLTEAQVRYDTWFESMANHFGVVTTEKNRWEMNFDTRKLTLVEA